MEYGEVRRGSIGDIGIEKLTAQLAEEVGAPNTDGALVSRMNRESEAYKAGLRPGDIIVGFNGTAIWTIRRNSPGWWPTRRSGRPPS